MNFNARDLDRHLRYDLLSTATIQAPAWVAERLRIAEGAAVSPESTVLLLNDLPFMAGEAHSRSRHPS